MNRNTLNVLLLNYLVKWQINKQAKSIKTIVILNKIYRALALYMQQINGRLSNPLLVCREECACMRMNICECVSNKSRKKYRHTHTHTYKRNKWIKFAV